MFDHVDIRVSDRAASEAFYDVVLGALGMKRTVTVPEYTGWGDFDITEETPVTQNMHIGFTARTRELADAFWRAGTEAGYRSDGEPGPRPQYGPNYYGAFLLDPDGNSIEAVHTDGVEERGDIDHLWIRVADVDASKAFYETVAPFAGFALRTVGGEPHRAQFTAPTGTFSVVDDGAPVVNVHVAFPASDDATVAAFHEAAVAAGYRDNGGPGERPQYHPGYFGAFVLDPDGNNIEVVHHNR